MECLMQEAFIEEIILIHLIEYIRVILLLGRYFPLILTTYEELLVMSQLILTHHTVIVHVVLIILIQTGD